MESTALKQIELCKLLMAKTQISQENADTLSHALTDISESFGKIYNEIMQRIANETDKEKTIELLWEIREQFRHIQYHINDAKLTELYYLKEKK